MDCLNCESLDISMDSSNVKGRYGVLSDGEWSSDGIYKGWTTVQELFNEYIVRYTMYLTHVWTFSGAILFVLT